VRYCLCLEDYFSNIHLAAPLWLAPEGRRAHLAGGVQVREIRGLDVAYWRIRSSR
jgi:hypothetical protein